MGQEGYEHRAFTAQNDKTDDAQQLSREAWREIHGDNAARMLGYQQNKDEIELVWNIAKAVPTGFAAFSSGLRHGASAWGVATPLAAAFGAEYLIDKKFFNDQPIRGGSMLFDLAAPMAIMALPIGGRYAMLGKSVAMVASHVVGKLIDRHGSPKLEPRNY